MTIQVIVDGEVYAACPLGARTAKISGIGTYLRSGQTRHYLEIERLQMNDYGRVGLKVGDEIHILVVPPDAPQP